MIQSMTGFGRSEIIFSDKKITVEIKSLNSKNLDLYLKLPNAYKIYELPIRKMIGDALQRGKIECTISVEEMNAIPKTTINKELILMYYNELSELSNQIGIQKSEIFSSILKFPDVFLVQETEISEEEWQKVAQITTEAIENLVQSRIDEGTILKADFLNSIDEIDKLLEEVPKYENQRIESIRERMWKALEKIGENRDENRFEQELIYYLEKLDVNEEKTRLKHHLKYFKTNMDSAESAGKKLGFIAQEIGREINTLGSKSYHAELQTIVVQMKDYLEKIKEQVYNTL